MHVLVTGVAGFIGMHTARVLLARGLRVTGVDNFSPYYDVALKRARLATLRDAAGFAFIQGDLAEPQSTARLFRDGAFTHVIHLAAQPGVRHSIEHPEAYLRDNLVAFGHVLEGCRHARVAHLVYASSSSVYGASHTLPFSEEQRVDRPVSLYAATKCANELMAHSYAHLFGLPVTMLRYFTVYGPWGRPDMAIWKFTEGLLAGTPIEVYAGGELSRDFTFVEDAAEATVQLLWRPPQRAPATQAETGAAVDAGSRRPDSSWAPFEIYNVGRSDPCTVNELLALLEARTGARALRRELPMQPGDVECTCADPSKLRAATGFEPRVALADGLGAFVDWFRGWRERRA